MTVKKRDARGLVLLKADYEYGGRYLSEQDAVYKPGSGMNRMVCLGEYDGLITMPLNIDPWSERYDASLMENTPLLRAVRKKNRELLEGIRFTQHFSTLYLVRSWEGSAEAAEQEEREISRFWSEEPQDEKAFFFLTSLYADPNGQPNIKALEEKLKKIQNQESDLTFDYLCYSSLQIAEEVVVWKCDRLHDVIRALELLCQEYNCYTRTICAIPYGRLMQKNLWPQAIGSGDQKRLLSVRVAVKSLDHMKWLVHSAESPFHRLLKKRSGTSAKNVDTMDHFIAHGYETYVGITLDVDESVFYELLRELFDFFSDPVFRQAVWHFETQFGIEFSQSSVKNKQELGEPKKTLLKSTVEKIVGEIEELAKTEWIKEQVWCVEFSAQARMLAQMANSYIMDAVCYLLIDSISYFCDWLKQQLYQDAERPPFHTPDRIARQFNDETNIGAILKFLKGCSRLSTHMFRSDAIMQLHPVMVPPPDNFCPAILDYCFAFFRRATEYLQKLEFAATASDRVERIFVHTLVPSLEHHMRTEEQLLDEEAKLKGAGSDCLLYLEVPYENMAEPYYMIASLVHESGHYFGNRCRHKRVHTILQCLCLRLVHLLRLNDDAQDFIYNTLYTRIRLEYGDLDEMLYLSVLKAQAEEAVAYLLLADENKRVLEYYVKEEDRKNLGEYVNRFLFADFPWFTGVSKLHRTILSYEYFLKECYADMIMAKTLRLSFQQYLRMFAFSFRPITFLPEADAEALRLRLWQRIFLTAETLQNNGAEGWTDFDAEISGFLEDQISGREHENELGRLPRDIWVSKFPAFFREAHRRYHDGENGDYPGFGHESPGEDPNEAFLLLPELHVMIKYLDACCEKYDSALEDRPDLRAMQENLTKCIQRDIIEDGIMEAGFMDVIFRNREDTLRRASEKYGISQTN